ncbi:methyl-accepting chemotaxis protein McpB [Clostridium saccharobutylicum]|uniref:methyl-accepting chemotaxis protein n=1 Tax=Clostridium saccharobutylicum TaxID=169679 RepID=UPI000983EDA4|nr:methyl-accepting chemotaxis protein [Clostridium saccharobutylicum]AQS09771.1 methyl-accepting chemotaxis protein McpB [Clostridium saccharobutylicum]MBC2436840.1 HAMP domain-containing protein [Clostridium saccharobutylicum]NSB89180.1 methyl-accepting chemotaxis protein [Clostridium saccharobutylicum]NYC27831.1 methyl-accepting chemotaxis protein [Clostridium saccharobutylicum]OOM17035.1 methyl-accepting chemotaxis protein McpB [Clostridium saccharobutylicum]
MDEKVLKKRESIKFKILTIPLAVMFTAILIISIITIGVVKTKVMEKMKSDGIELANQIANQADNNNAAMSSLNESIEERIRTLANFVANNSDKVNNDYLSQLAKQFNVDEINFTDSTGKIIYSNLQPSIGSVFGSDHISYPVLKGDKNEFMENIRKSRETNNYYKYGYVRKNDGGMVQVGILANKVQSLSTSLEMQTLIEKLTDGQNVVYAAFIDKNSKIVAHSEKDNIGNNEDNEGIKTALNGKVYSKMDYYKGKIQVHNIMVPVDNNGEQVGVVELGISTDGINKTINRIIALILIIAIASIIVISVIMFKIANGITKPLAELVNISQKISKGEFDNDVSINSTGEIGILQSSFNYMSDSLRSTIKKIKDEISTVNNMASSLSSNAEQMTAATGEVTNSIQEISAGASKQSNDLLEIADHISNLADEVNNIENKISNVKESSAFTEDKVKIGKEQMEVLLKSIEDIKKAFEVVDNHTNNLNLSVSQVGQITYVINEISEQTNLLALNAAIEASRAGEAGRGFAVVAEEVRTLAEQSKQSTEQIQKLIQSISGETINVIDTSDQVKAYIMNQVGIVKETMNSFNDMLDAVAKISPLAEDTYASIEKTIRVKNTVSDKVDNITAVSEETTAESEEISASSEELLASSEEVSKFASKLSDVAEEISKETSKFKY